MLLLQRHQYTLKLLLCHYFALPFVHIILCVYAKGGEKDGWMDES